MVANFITRVTKPSRKRKKSKRNTASKQKNAEDAKVVSDSANENQIDKSIQDNQPAEDAGEDYPMQCNLL